MYHLVGLIILISGATPQTNIKNKMQLPEMREKQKVPFTLSRPGSNRTGRFEDPRSEMLTISFVLSVHRCCVDI